MSISFIVLSFNQKENIVRIINSIEYANLHDYEIIVVDNMSTDDTESYVNNYCNLNNITSVKFFLNDSKMNQSKGRNIGVKESSKDYIYFVDGDDSLNSIFLNKIQYNLTTDVVFIPRVKKHIHESVYTVIQNNIALKEYYPSAVHGFYKKSKIIELNIRHEENTFFYYSEDLIFSSCIYYNILEHNLTYSTYDDYIYCYFGIKTSTSTQYNDKEFLIKYYESMYNYLHSLYHKNIDVMRFICDKIFDVIKNL